MDKRSQKELEEGFLGSPLPPPIREGFGSANITITKFTEPDKKLWKWHPIRFKAPNVADSWHLGNTCLLVCKCMVCYEQFLCLATGDINRAGCLSTITLTLTLQEALGDDSLWAFPHTLNMASPPMF